MDRLESLSTLGLDLDRDQVRRLDEYEELLRERSRGLGLIAKNDLPRLFERHILDSLRAASALADEEVCDLGSGAGLPGIPLAIALPRCTFTLCEPRRRRVGFLELVVERLELSNAAVTLARAGQLPSQSADACTARAFASLEESWEGGLPDPAKGRKAPVLRREGMERSRRRHGDPFRARGASIARDTCKRSAAGYHVSEVIGHGDP